MLWWRETEIMKTAEFKKSTVMEVERDWSGFGSVSGKTISLIHSAGQMYPCDEVKTSSAARIKSLFFAQLCDVVSSFTVCYI